MADDSLTIMNASALIICRLYSCIPDVLVYLAWFRVPQRIQFKVGDSPHTIQGALRTHTTPSGTTVYKLCTIIYMCLHQTVPVYLQDMCVPVSTTASRRYLRSAARGDLQVLATKTVTFGPRSFASSAPKLWNSLPLPFRDSTLTLRQFSSRLKTHLFSLAYGRASWLLRL